MSIFSTLIAGFKRAVNWLAVDPIFNVPTWRERWEHKHGRPWLGMVPPIGAESTAARKAEVQRVRWERKHLVPWPGAVPPQPRPPAPMRELTPHEAMLEIGRGERAGLDWKLPALPEMLIEGEPLTSGELDMIRRARRKGVPTLFPGERVPSGPLDGLPLPELKLLALKVEAEILQRRARALGGTRCDVSREGVGMVAGGNITAGAVVNGIQLASGTLVLFPSTAREAPPAAESSDGMR